MNWFILIPVGTALLVLVVFLVMRNQKDEKEFEKQMNNDFHKSKGEGSDIDLEDIVK